MERWIGKIALITGVTSGIGEAITRTFVASGINVLGLARREEKLKELSDEFKNAKGKFHFLQCNLRNENDIFNAFKYVDKLGGADILINNAGVSKLATITDSSTDDFREILDTNVLAPAICIREFIKSKQRSEGHIFNINSILGHNATLIRKASLYPASKFALRGLTDTIKQEIAHKNLKIRVTGIHPSVVKTDIFRAAGSSDEIFRKLPYLQSKDVVDCILFALSAPPTVQLDEITVTAYTKNL